jgi:hypothetical protein
MCVDEPGHERPPVTFQDENAAVTFGWDRFRGDALDQPITNKDVHRVRQRVCGSVEDPYILEERDGASFACDSAVCAENTMDRLASRPEPARTNEVRMLE